MKSTEIFICIVKYVSHILCLPPACASVGMHAYNWYTFTVYMLIHVVLHIINSLKKFKILSVSPLFNVEDQNQRTLCC